MKAYHFESPATGLVAVDIPDPIPAPGQVVLGVEAAGLCHSDVHILHGAGNDWLGKRPIVLGHEVSGTVTALGSHVEDFAVGDRVAIALVTHPIDQVDRSNAVGLGYDGGYAQKVLAPVGSLVRIPDGVSFDHAAVATDSIVTAYHAVVAEAEVEPGATVCVIGLGGLGLNAVRFSVLQGATVFGVDIDASAFPAATANGAKACFAAIGDVPGPIDAVIDFVGAESTTAQAVSAVKTGGRVVLVGLGAAEATIPTHLLVTKSVQLRGSLGASISELQAVFEILAKQSLIPVVEEVAFDDLGSAMRRLEHGDVRGRLVTHPQ